MRVNLFKFSENVIQRRRKRKFAAVKLLSTAGVSRRRKGDARALELMRIFADAEPVAAQGRLERRTIR